MEYTTLPKYSINPPPTEDEIKRAKELMAIAKQELENEPPLSPEETIKKFEELRQNIINQCRENGTLDQFNDID